ncbi:hypothetical protein L3V82_04595 [Thiotrichales bacterium 19S3-7]|nr:hypothetical protein [Thiotrichales bacterium 19S3-7]MCF6801375.1 hypothetical protein [Thiotrichales bacterium 19S3-11]
MKSMFKKMFNLSSSRSSVLTQDDTSSYFSHHEVEKYWDSMYKRQASLMTIPEVISSKGKKKFKLEDFRKLAESLYFKLRYETLHENDYNKTNAEKIKSEIVEYRFKIEHARSSYGIITAIEGLEKLVKENKQLFTRDNSYGSYRLGYRYKSDHLFDHSDHLFDHINKVKDYVNDFGTKEEVNALRKGLNNKEVSTIIPGHIKKLISDFYVKTPETIFLNNENHNDKLSNEHSIV